MPNGLNQNVFLTEDVLFYYVPPIHSPTGKAVFNWEAKWFLIGEHISK